MPGSPAIYFARVDTGANGDCDAALQLKLGIEGGQPFAHLRSGAHRPKGVVLVNGRNPEHGHDRIAYVLLDGAAWRWSTARASPKKRSMTRRTASGSSCSPRLVQPVTSVKTTVTVFLASSIAPSLRLQGGDAYGGVWFPLAHVTP
jgi:hypothetical protein